MVEYDERDVKRFWNNVDIRGENDCWNWLSHKDKDGYGRPKIKRKSVRANRFAYIITFGNISDNIWVLHTCDNPSCVNPNHLFLGTVQDNVKDMINKNRSLKGSKNPGSKLSEDAVIEIRKLYKDEDVPTLEIANKFNIGITTVRRVALGESWNFIPNEIYRRDYGKKLKIETVEEIRNLYKTKNYLQKELALMFGVTPPNIGKIINNLIWKKSVT